MGMTALRLDLVGHVVNHLTVVAKAHGHESGNPAKRYWLCKCDCGQFATVVERALIAPNPKQRKQACTAACSRKPDLVGKKYGKLLVLRWLSHDEKGHLWECLCDCGKTVQKLQNELLCNRSKKRPKSCNRHCNKVNNLLGQRFGKLLITQHIHKPTKPSYCWIAVCDCGKTVEVNGHSLTTGEKKSCGCSCYHSGKDHHWFKHDLTTEERQRSKKRAMLYPELHPFIRSTFFRDAYTCQVTGVKRRKGTYCPLNAHHLLSWCDHADLRFVPTNVITVAAPVHALFHSMYGRKNATPEQFKEFCSFFVKQEKTPDLWKPEVSVEVPILKLAL